MSEKTITRQQRRYQERVKNDAMKTLNALVTKFYEFFMENDPDSHEIAVERKKLSAKWKMYCHSKQLLPPALTLCEEHIDRIIEKYQEQLKAD